MPVCLAWQLQRNLLGRNAQPSQSKWLGSREDRFSYFLLGETFGNSFLRGFFGFCLGVPLLR
jgi:hypothetical protein